MFTIAEENIIKYIKEDKLEAFLCSFKTPIVLKAVRRVAAFTHLPDA